MPKYETYDNYTFGKNVLYYRTIMRMSQEELAGLSFTSKSQISDIENAKILTSPEMMNFIARALNVDLRLLLNRDDELIQKADKLLAQKDYGAEMIKTAAALLKKSRKSSPYVRAKALRVWAYLRYKRQQYRKALPYYRKALQIGQVLKDGEVVYQALYSVISCHVMSGHFEAARSTIEGLKSLRVTVSGDDLAKLHLLIGIVQHSFRRLIDSKDSLFIALEIAESDEVKAHIHQVIGEVYRLMKNTEQSELHSLKAIDFARLAEHHGHERFALQTLGELFYGLGEADKAREYFSKAMALIVSPEAVVDRMIIAQHLAICNDDHQESKRLVDLLCWLDSVPLLDKQEMCKNAAKLARKQGYHEDSSVLADRSLEYYDKFVLEVRL